jgi:hypothetical protein
MQIAPVRTVAARMSILLCVVAALDVAAVFLSAKPQLWCAVIPALIPILTPVAMFARRAGARS